MPPASIKKLMHSSLVNLSSEDGINASGRDEIYGCVFGRDSAITIMKILNVIKKEPNQFLLETSKKTLLTLINLQGRIKDTKTGEEPGKFIHEFRKDKYEHLISSKPPWFLHKDKTLKNYDSIDSTPLALITIYKFYEITKDEYFLADSLKAVRFGLEWLLNYADRDNDGLIEYSFKRRKFGGLRVQSWTDSTESLEQADGTFPKYPIAPVEAQSYAWLAAHLWADYFEKYDLELSLKLRSFARKIKKVFNKKFKIQDNGNTYFAQALDGNKNQIKTITANPLLALWTSYEKHDQYHSIIEKKYIPDVIKRVFQPDMFVTDYGIRTMSSNSATYNPNQDSYHNGSFWPFLNGLIHEGLLNFGFTIEAEKLKLATLKPIKHFQTPIELYVKDEDGYKEYRNADGQVSTRQQAWSAAAILDLAYC